MNARARDQESERLRGEPAPEPPEGWMVDEIVVRCPGNAEAVLSRSRELLGAVVEHSSDPWPSLEEWKRALPRWFLDACVDDRHVQTCVLDRWSLRAWLHWLQPANRHWYWWEAAQAEPTTLRVRVLVRREDYLRGSLEWLLRAAGAAGVVAGRRSDD